MDLFKSIGRRYDDSEVSCSMVSEGKHCILSSSEISFYSQFARAFFSRISNFSGTIIHNFALNFFEGSLRFLIRYTVYLNLCVLFREGLVW